MTIIIRYAKVTVKALNGNFFVTRYAMMTAGGGIESWIDWSLAQSLTAGNNRPMISLFGSGH
jgi:hypothetical protein